MMDEFYWRKLYALLPPDTRPRYFSNLTQLEEWWRGSREGIALTHESWIHLAEAIGVSGGRAKNVRLL